MSVEECLRLAERRAKEERRAEGWVDGGLVTIHLRRAILWAVFVLAHGECSRKGFYRRKSADGYFDRLKREYGLEEGS